MAKPINLYQGPAPAAMGMMGQGILEAGANIGRTIQGGYESMGKSLGEGIKSAASSVAGAYTQSKQDQAKFDATKKLVKAWESFLPTKTDPVTGAVTTPVADEIKSILADTTISTREKIEMTPMLFNIIGNAQQQYGRESVANIMTGSREAIAAAKNPPRPLPQFDATQGSDPLKQVVGQASAEPAPAPAAPYMIQRPPAQPQPMKGPLSNMPKIRRDPDTNRMQFWSPGAKRYIDESENDLLFGPNFRITPY